MYFQTDLLLTGAGVVIALALRYIPKLKDFWLSRDNASKGRYLLLVSLILPLLGTGAACLGVDVELGLFCPPVESILTWGKERVFASVEVAGALWMTYTIVVKPTKSATS